MSIVDERKIVFLLAKDARCYHPRTVLQAFMVS